MCASFEWLVETEEIVRCDLEDVGMAGIYLEDPWVILASSQSSEGKPVFIHYTLHHEKCILTSLVTIIVDVKSSTYPSKFS